MKLKLKRTPEMDDALEAQRNEVDRIVKFMRKYPLFVRRTEYPDHVELELSMGPDDTEILLTVNRHAAQRLEQAIRDLATLARAAEIERADRRDGQQVAKLQTKLRNRKRDALARRIAEEELSRQKHGYLQRTRNAMEKHGHSVSLNTLKDILAEEN